MHTNTYGYDYSKKSGNIVINPEEAAMVREIYTWHSENKWGINKIASMLNLRGTRSKTGVNWYRSRVTSILTNPLMCGRLLCIGELIEGRHEGIISVEQFEAAQTVQQGRTFIPTAASRVAICFRSLARCDTCGLRLIGHMAVNKKSGKQYFSYLHPQVPKAIDRTNCSFTKRVHILDNLVVEQIRELSTNGKMEKLLLKDVQSRRISDHGPKIKERDRILLELGNMDELFLKWAERLDHGKIGEGQFEKQNTKLLTRKKQLQERLQVIQHEVGDEEQLQFGLAEVKRTLNDFPTVRDALEHEERRDVLRLLVESLTITKERAEFKLLFMEPITIPLKSQQAR